MTTESAAQGLLGGLFGNNPYFDAGFGLMGLTVGLGALRKGAIVGSTALRRRLLVTLEMNNKDPSYVWFLTWMSHQAQAQAQAAKALTSPSLNQQNPSFFARKSAAWLRSHQLSVETIVEQRENGSSSVEFMLVAGPGTHIFRYQGAWIQVKREREIRASLQNSGMPWETVTLTTLSRDRSLFPALLTEARNIAMRGKEGKLVVHTAWGIEWRPFGRPRQKRPLESVILAPGMREKIEGDVRAFLDRRQWYAERGIPYRRGYLLKGPPGSGKSSFIQALAGSLGYDICLLNLSERGLGDDKLYHLLSNIPPRSFVLIEDVDAAFNKRVQTSEDGYQSSVTFSGFLNALDGVVSGEERIIFMTTNHAENLDPALVRPGRVDVSELIDDATPEQARNLFLHFYRGSDELPSNDELERLGDAIREQVRRAMQNGTRISMAALQGLFIRSTAQEAVPACEDLLKLIEHERTQRQTE